MVYCERRVWCVRNSAGAGVNPSSGRDFVLAPEFGLRGDMKDHHEFELILSEMELAHPGKSSATLATDAKKCHQFLHMIPSGDLAIVPSEDGLKFSVGLFKTLVTVDENDRPGRAMAWLSAGIDLNLLNADIRHSMGSRVSFCQIDRANIVDRLRAVMEGRLDPGPGVDIDLSSPDIADAMQGRMYAKIHSCFGGHAFAEFVGSLLEASGYRCQLAPPGPDGGVDIDVRRDLLMTGNRVLVQVKSDSKPVGRPIVQQLIGTVHSQKVGSGLLVSASGFTSEALAEIRANRGLIEAWDGRDVTRMTCDLYAQLPVRLRDRLGFRQVWVC